jgi:hypothetical protein
MTPAACTPRWSSPQEPPPISPQRLRQAVIAAVTSTGAMAPAFDVQPVSTLARERGGKLRLVRSV